MKKRESVMEYYDVHNHFFWQGPLEAAKEFYGHFKGLVGVSLIIIEEAPSDWNEVKLLVPKAYHDIITVEMIRVQRKAFRLNEVLEELFIFPFLDTRFFRSHHVKDLMNYLEQEYLGVKVLYIPEEDETIGVEGWENVFGRSVRKSEQMIADMIETCDRLNVPVLFHADLKRYNDFVCDLIRAYPKTRFNVPHFGQSRKMMATVLESYPNCYTDFSSLLPYMKQTPKAYRDFIEAFSNRIMFGSDAIFYRPDMLKEYVEFIESLFDGALLKKIVHDNYRCFHGLNPDGL